MKIIFSILLVSNIAMGWMYFYSKTRSNATVDVCKALLPFYLRQWGQSVDVHKILDGENLPYTREGNMFTAGYLQIEFGDHGVAKDVQIKSK